MTTPQDTENPAEHVQPSQHYCSDAALQELIDSPHIPEVRKPAMRAEMQERARWHQWVTQATQGWQLQPSQHYCSDAALQELIDSPHIAEDRKLAMRAELWLRRAYREQQK